MISELQSIKKDLWQYLAETDKKIVMYGMGNGADKILAVCERYGIEICDFFASDGFVRGHSFHGKVVLSYSDVKAKYVRYHAYRSTMRGFLFLDEIVVN